MRELDDVDLLTLCVEALPFEQGLDLMLWGIGPYGDHAAWKRWDSHPSARWWLNRHVREIAVALSPKYFPKRRK